MLSPLPSTLPAPARRAARDRRRLPALTAVSAMFAAALGAVAPGAYAASVTSAVFSGGAGTYTAANGAVYAKQGAALTLTVQADADTKCVTVNARQTSGSLASVDLDRSGTSPFVFTTGLDIFTAGAGNGLVQVTSVVGYKQSNGRKCVANQGETYSQTPGYTLDNTAPTATGVVTPAPNAAGWNKADAAITWSATDAGGSGVKTVTPATDTVTTEGTVTRTTTVTDNVGNSTTSAPVTVRLDKTAPTITGSRTPAPNADGWNNTDVAVSFVGSDTPGSGVKSLTGPVTLSSSAANQSVTGTVVDNADNSASTTVGDINIDKVAPTLSGTPRTAANDAGWYRGDVVVGWTASDALSGTTTPADTTIGGEGIALTSTASVSDKAGNTSGSVQSAPAVKIDRTAPNTTVTAPPAWNKTDVTLTLVPHDGLSGVAGTFYRLDGGNPVAGTSVPVASEGSHTLTFWSTDVAGNAEAPHTVEFGIDKSSPTIGHTQDPAANADGWNNDDVTITFQCSDAVSGVASCTGPQTVSTEGRGQVVTGTVTDRAGNTATDPAAVSIDKTKPVIGVDALPAPDANGWYRDDVTATFTASDALSGVKTQDRSHTFGEGADQTATATATDAAGNSASVTTSKVSVDKTAPTITGTVVSVPNAEGWFTGDVTVTWTCADTLSGVVACPEDSLVTGEGSNRSVSASVSDRAGHTTTATVADIKIDRTAPATSTTDVPGGWVKDSVTVGFSGTDNLSGVWTTWFAVDGANTPTQGDEVTLGDEGEHTVTYWSIDEAGNRETAKSFTVRLDLSSPTVTVSQAPATNGNGWNNTDVTVSFSCADQVRLSGLASCSAPQTITTEGRAQEVTGTATDNAGNSSSGTATVNIDKTAPTITGAPDRAANAAGWYRGDVTVGFTGGDELSGIDSVTTPVTLAEEGESQSVDGTATDNAGNTATTTVSGINIDRTAPNLSAAPTKAPNENGWYNTDVTQTWSADDPLSGLAGDKPADEVLTHEGEGQTVSASVSDRAGNTTSATSAPVKIDKTAPSTDVSAPSGWVNTGVNVTLNPSDALSGVSSTHYRVDDGAWTVGDDAEQTVVALTSEGTHTIEFFSGDLAGNREASRTVTVLIDRSNPTITHELDPAANANGWNKADVTVTFTCEDQDGLSGVASCTTPQTVTTEGKNQPVPGTATDNAGNTATDPATVSLDKTKPTIVGSRTPAANAAGWNNTDVKVHFDAADTLSGIASVTPDTTLGEGTDQSVEGTAVDAADNWAKATVGGINVDQTAPTLSGAPTTAANAKGWYRGDVVIGWTAADVRSGIASAPADSTITGEGAGLRESATVLDRAGNETTAQSAPVNIDRTAPTTGANAPTGWNNSEVTITLQPADGLSGVDATYHRLDGAPAQAGTLLTIGTQGVHTLTYWSVDEAGNVEAPHTTTVRIDLTLPTVGYTVTPKPNAKGWNKTAVTVAYQCADDLSGVASCSADTEVTTDGADQAAPGTAVDNAGNSRTVDARVSIDTVLPTISGAPDRDPNTHNWYAGDVKVSFTCNDALSGIGSCSQAATLGEGRGQNSRGSAVDVAGNTADTTVGPVNVDKTAPTLTGAATTGPNPAGWYNDDVTVRWTAGDSLSGLDGAAPGDSVISGEGANLTTSASVRDLAGNQISASSAPVKIDRTAPATTVSNVSDWSGSDVTVTLTPTDNLSGVVATHYKLDDEDVADGTEVTITTEGTHQLKVWSVDEAGNVEAHKNVEVKIDKTAPGISHTQAPAANTRGWNRTDVTVSFTCTDSGSGIASCTSPVTKGEGGAQKVQGTATDKAGNSATDETTVNVDKTKPTITGGLSAAANSHGWFKAAVKATFTCADQDGLSGVLSCPPPQTLGEGENQSAGGTATDAADNESDRFALSGINVDTTVPVLTGATTAAPNAAGWFRGDVTVRWSASDALSGLDGPKPADSTVTGEGANLAALAGVADRAGNTTGASVGGIRIDRTAPNTTATAPAGWQSGDVTVRLTASDNLSDVASTHYTVDGGARQNGTTVTVTADGSHDVEFWSVDKAGNTETASTVTVLVDKGAPTITGAATRAPNDAGWYNAPVTVHFDCADAVSGIASCQPDATLAAQGTNSATGTAVDNARNTATATVGNINVDTVPPAVTIGGVVDGRSYTLGAVPAPTATATDATSGLAAPASGTTTGGLANGVGTYTYTATATDNAGNVGRATVTYKVVYGYGSTLFLQPVNDTAHQTGLSTSVFNAGQTIPMKFQLKNAAGQVVQTVTAPKWLTPVKGSPTNAAVNEAAYSDTATTGGSYTWSPSQYQYNWKTEKSQAGSYWRVGVALDDGQTYYVNIALR